MTTYYILQCETCKEKFLPILATTQNELLYPEYEEVQEQVGTRNADALQDFHDRHRGHTLTVILDRPEYHKTRPCS